MISPHLPALQIVLPLLSAPVCVLLRRSILTYAVTVAICWLTFAIAVLLLQQVLASGPISYRLGGWAPPWGIEYRVDTVNAYVLLIVSAIGAIVITAARPTVEREVGEDVQYLFYTCALLCLAGMLGVTITGDAFNLFVFLEISSLSSYVLVSLRRDRRALTAAFHYLIFGTIGATFYLIGVGLLYQATGTLNIADLAVRVAGVTDSQSVRAAFAFMVVGIAIKAAVFPVHIWLPNAYAYAPSIVSALLAATATKVAIYVLLRVFLTIFGPVFAFSTMPLGEMLVALAVVAMFVGSAVAIFQEDVKRMLAYSSVAQIGYMILGIGLATSLGLTGGILHLFNHAVIKGGLFLVMACVFYRIGSVQLVDFAGLGRRMPWTMAAFVVGGLSLIGVPLTTGFVSKWYLILGALDKGWWWLAVLILLSSLLAVIYVWRVVEVAYFRAPPEAATRLEAPVSLLVPTWVLIAANIYFGIDTRVSVGVAKRAAEALMGVGA